MTDILESSVWESGVYQLETDDPVLGGAPAFDAGIPVTGHANAQAQQLANRTKWLYDNKISTGDLADTNNSDKGSSLVGFKQSGAGTIPMTVFSKIKEVVSLQDFGAVGDGVVDDTSAVQLAVSSGYKWLYLGQNKTYKLTSNISGYSTVNFFGENSKFTSGLLRVWDVDCYGKLKMPSTVTSFWPYPVYFNSDTSGFTDFDVRSQRPSGKRYYVSNLGNNSNDGLTINTALADIKTAIEKSDVVEIAILAGDYSFRNNAIGSFTLQRNISIFAFGGKVKIYGCDLGSFNVWTQNGTYSNVYQCNIATTAASRQVWDSKYQDADGYFTEYSKKAIGNLAEVSNTPGSYLYDSGIMYIRTIDDRIPDGDIRVWRGTDFIVNGNYKLYMQDIDWIGVQSFSIRDSVGTQPPTFIGVNCSWSYSDSPGINGSGNFRTEGGNSILVNCKSFKGYYDGFNYHMYSSLNNPGWHVEIDCVAIDNGASGLGNNQGSTIHDGSKILRINGLYARNEGANIEDVSENSVSYNIGCTLESSYRITSPRQLLIGSGCTSYLVGVKFKGITGNDVAIAGATAKMYHYKTSIGSYSGDVYLLSQFNPVAN